MYGNGLGEVVQAPIGVKLDDENGIEPDLVYISTALRSIVTERELVGAPDLVVEVLSPATQSRDRGVKMRRYAAAGVPHYWLLDYRRQRLEPCRLGSDGYELVGTFRPGHVFRPELFPDLEIRIDALFA